MQQLSEFGQATVGADGTAQVTLQPDGVTRWHITRMVVKTSQTSTETPIPRCAVYTDHPGDGQEVDVTYTGNWDASDCSIWREPSSPIIARWEGGIPGTIATISVYGERIMA